ncbi:hypothetical protein [Acidisoma sp.]|uniref:hypothetical protein n=1 Tax=Acidisoma sp. TaxID=1872115 RepID=UPI003AFFEA18
MSASISEQTFQYVGILNGVMYRIDPATGRSIEPMPGSRPFNSWGDFSLDEPSASADAAFGPSDDTSVMEIATEAGAVEQAVSVERVAAPSNLFPRSGAEPLRAGHPDLWALLVAGTCLEGTPFSAL